MSYNFKKVIHNSLLNFIIRLIHKVILIFVFSLKGLIELSLIIVRDYFDVDLFHFMIWGIPCCCTSPNISETNHINRMLKQ